MSNGFTSMTLTTKGLALEAKAKAGHALNFTRIAVGSGTCSDPSGLDELISQKMSLSISKIIASGAMTTVCSALDNSGLAVGFNWAEIGLFATDPDIGEILYGWAGAGTGEISIPAGSESVFTSPVNLGVITSGMSNVTATISSSLVYVSLEDFETHTDNSDIHVTAAQKTVWTAKQDATNNLAEDANPDTSDYIATYDTATGTHKKTLLGAVGILLKSVFDSVYAAISHVHGNITNEGAIGATANLPVFTGASGVLTTKTAADGNAALGQWAGTCSTAAATAAKIVTCANFTLVDGYEIEIIFQNLNTASPISLAINGQTAIQVTILASSIYSAYRIPLDAKFRYSQSSTSFECLNPIMSGGALSAGAFMVLGSGPPIPGYLSPAAALALEGGGCATCATAAATAAKVAVLSGYVRTIGGPLTVAFSAQNTVDAITVNCNAQGAGAVYYNGAAVKAAQVPLIADLVWDGTYYQLQNPVKRLSKTATLAVASWTGSAAPYSYVLSDADILATDTPHIDRVTGTDASAAALINTAWGLITGYAVKPQTAAGTITFYASAIPAVVIPIQYEVVRS